jgi:hypothetical protein
MKYISLSTRNASKRLDSLSQLQIKILDSLFDYHRRFGRIFPSQETIATELGYKTVKPIAQNLKHLQALGFIVIEKRPYTSNEILFTDLFRIDSVVEVAKRLFKNFYLKAAVRFLSLSLLFSFKTLYPEDYRDCIKSDLVSSSSLRLFLYQSVSRSKSLYAYARPGNEALESSALPARKKRNMEMEMKQTLSTHTALIISICRALKKRGAPVTNEVALKLAAFSVDVLQHCCAVMKHSTPKNPIGFLISEAIKQTNSEGKKPNWKLVDFLKEQNVIVLMDGWDAQTTAPDTQKQEQREPDCVVKARSVDIGKEQEEAMIAFEKAPVKNEFMQILAAGWNRQTEVIEPEVIERPVTRAAFLGTPLTNRDILSDADQFSNTGQEISSPGILESSGFKHFNPGAILKGFEYGNKKEE